MKLPLHADPIAEALWHVQAFGNEQYPPGRAYWWNNRDRHAVGTHTAQLSTAGSIILRDPAGDTPISPGQLILFRHGDDTAYGKTDPAQPYACRWVNLLGVGLDPHLTLFRQRFGPVLTLGDKHPIIDQLGSLQTLADPHAGTPRTTLAHAVHTFVMMLFEHAEQRQHHRMSPVERAIESMVRNPHRPWSLKRLASECGCSREHLSREFRQRLGVTPHRYLVEARTRRALRLLRDTDLPMHEVAEQAGFPSAHNLTRQVRKATRLSPTDIRADR